MRSPFRRIGSAGAVARGYVTLTPSLYPLCEHRSRPGAVGLLRRLSGAGQGVAPAHLSRFRARPLPNGVGGPRRFTMLSRRTFLAGAAAPAAAPLVSADVGRAEAAATLPLDLVNRRAGRAAFAVVTGLDPVSRRWFFMAADGRTRIYAGDPARAVAL